tara:strand:+ start:359 stop:910 length:552 start_codon:yes stop_codon:yes gene_type:complete
MIIELIIYIFSNVITNIITFKRDIHIPNEPLIDIIQSNNYFNSYLNNLHLKKKICDIFPFLCVCFVNNFKKYIECHSYLILLRFICFHSTILPSPMKLENRYIFGIVPNYTYDLIFSGHTMTCVLSIFCTQKIFIPYCFLLSVLCSISVIVTKEHYTIDTIIAWIATYSVVSFYSIDFEQLLD